jgi:GrpB-like predicted nucleotidyltransferase (UPF0157 family)
MKKYIFRPYDEKFPEYYSRQEKNLREQLGKTVEIEHVGSSSVPGLGGKGFIDIAIGVLTKSDLEEAAKKMLAAGYHFEPGASTNERYYYDCEFIDDNKEQSMYHFHLTCLGSRDWIELIAFRDFLRNNDWAAKEYADIKKLAAQRANQKRGVYVKIKSPLIERLLRMAVEDIPLKKVD